MVTHDPHDLKADVASIRSHSARARASGADLRGCIPRVEIGGPEEAQELNLFDVARGDLVEQRLGRQPCSVAWPRGRRTVLSITPASSQ
jgi:hypothetical protein